MSVYTFLISPDTLAMKWSVTTVKGILKNEKYKGDALLQKSYTVDYLTKKTKMNEGEIPQYYVEGDHMEAIIEPAIFDQVQIELERRAPDGTATVESTTSPG